MKIRTRLLLFLLPTIVGFIALISLLLDLNRYKEIRSGVEQELRGVVLSCADLVSTSSLDWLNPSNAIEKAAREQYREALSTLQQQLRMTKLYVIAVQPNAVVGDELVSELDSFPEEALESSFYFTRTKSMGTKTAVFTAYAPIKNAQEQIVALMVAERDAAIIDQQIQESLLFIILVAAVAIILVAICAVLIAHHISRPLEQLKDSALAIAAGQYDINIQIEGPQEITDLANTLNTMSECLEENLTHLRENSLVRERMYGEYECGMLLQYYMLQKVVESYRHPRLTLKAISLPSNNLYGVHFKMSTNSEEEVSIQFFETEEKGFDPLYDLLTNAEKLPGMRLELRLPEDNTADLTPHLHEASPALFVWSKEKRAMAQLSRKKYRLKKGDLFFIYNQGLSSLLPDPQVLQGWFSKVLRHFASEGLAPCMTMLDKELHFLTRKRHIEHDVHIIGVEV
jgi:HAMP domain-containing protein